MHRGDHRRCPLRWNRHTALFHDAERAPKQRLGGRGAETDDDVRAYERDFLFEPRVARANFAGARRLVDPPFGVRVARPFEVLHGIGDINVVAVDAGSIERVIE